MKYVFFGTPEFAATVLGRLLHADMPPVALVCNPDRPVGRKKIITPPPVKTRILNLGSRIKNNIAIFQPENLLDSRSQILDTNADFAVVAAYAKIIPKSVIELFPKGVIGVHPSLLPKYRGASPIQSAILGGETETGVTLYLLDEKMDHGQIIASSEWRVASGDTYPTLEKKLAELSGELLVETLPKFITGKTEPRTQSEDEATYTKKFTSEDGFIQESDLSAALAGNSEKAMEIDRKIRALGAEPGVYTLQNEKRTKLLEAKIENGRLVLTKIQEEGGKPKSIAGA